MRIKMGYPSHETERQILRSRTTDNADRGLEPIADVSDVLTMQETVTRIKVDSSLHDYALEIVNRTRKSDQLALGVSPRGTLMLQRAAQARAFLEGREYCLPDDFKQLAVAVFSHRVVASTRHASLQKKSETTETVFARDRRFCPRTPVNLRASLANFWEKADRPGVRAFFLSMAALSVAFILALYSGAAARIGNLALASATALSALLVAGWVGRDVGAGAGETDTAALDHLPDGVSPSARRLDLYRGNRAGCASGHQYRE